MATVTQPQQKIERLRPTWTIGDDFSFEIPADAHTLEGFLRWEDSIGFPERGRIDFLGGRLFIDMAAAEIHSHEALKSRVGFALCGTIFGEERGRVFLDNTRYVSRAADSGVEPDLLVCLYDSIRAGRVRFPRVGKGR